MRVYHFLRHQHGLSNIRERHLKIATINALNDPFEMIAAASPNAAVRAALLRTRDEMDRHFGLLCFSRAWHNPVQWAHYAESHRGLCLGFDVPDAMLTPVRYSRTRLTIDPAIVDASATSAEAFMTDLISTKSSHWRYENEVRCFVRLEDRDPATGHYFADFSDALALREVIVGALSDISRADVAEALGTLAHGVRSRRARLAFRSFKVVMQRRRSMWL